MTNRNAASMHQEQRLNGSEFITQCDEQNYGAVSEVSEITGWFCFLCCFRDSQLELKKLSKREGEEIILKGKIKDLTLLCYNIFIKKKNNNQTRFLIWV